MTPYTTYPDIQGIIYQDDMDINRLMRTDELHKFSDGTLNHVRTALNDIATGIQIEYLTKRKWTKQDKQRARVMIKCMTETQRLKMEILLKPTSKKLMVADLCNSIRIKLVTTGKKRWCDSIRIKLVPEHVKFDESDIRVLERLNTSAGNHVKEILLKLNIPDHMSILTDSKILKDGGEEFQRSFRHSDTERLSRSDEVLKLKNFKKDATLKLFKSTNQERYEHVGPEVTSSQDGKVYKMAKRDYAWLMISRCSRSHFHIQDKGTSSNLKSMITTSNHKLMIEVKRAQD
ncbi:hypothetical protein Tco_1133808 [Tanacetum coccineum]